MDYKDYLWSLERDHEELFHTTGYLGELYPRVMSYDEFVQSRLKEGQDDQEEIDEDWLEYNYELWLEDLVD